MGVNEPFRCIVIGHARLILALIVLPIVVLYVMESRATTEYISSARIQASSAVLGSSTEADSVLNRVQGVATSRAVVDRAIQAAGIVGRDGSYVAKHEVTITRLGSSTVMDVSVTDPNPAVAQRLSSALATQVIDFVSGDSAPSTALVTQLDQQQQQLLSQRQQTVAELNLAKSPGRTAGLSAQLSTLDQELSDVYGTLRQLQVAVATGSTASLISDSDPAIRLSNKSPIRLVLGGVGGLIAALLIGSIWEMLRPRLAGAPAVARELGTVRLGRLPRGAVSRWRRRLLPDQPEESPSGWLRRHISTESPPAVLDGESAMALRHAAGAANVSVLALVGARSPAAGTELARRLTTFLQTPNNAINGSVNGASGSVNGLNGIHGINGSTNGLANPASRRRGGSDGRRSNPGGGYATATTTATVTKAPGMSRQSAGPVARRELQVLPVGEVDADSTTQRCGLLVLAGQLAPLAYVQRVRDLQAATGWPVIGVMDLGRAKGARR